jgi:hypothetical protein
MSVRVCCIPTEGIDFIISAKAGIEYTDPFLQSINNALPFSLKAKEVISKFSEAFRSLPFTVLFFPDLSHLRDIQGRKRTTGSTLTLFE